MHPGGISSYPKSPPGAPLQQLNTVLWSTVGQAGQAPDLFLGFCPTVQNHDGENVTTLEINGGCAANALLYMAAAIRQVWIFFLTSQL